MQNPINKQERKVEKIDQGGQKAYIAYTTTKQTNLYKYSSFLLEFTDLFLYSFLYYFFITHYYGQTLI